jgi:hypothetical protein
MRKIFKFSKLKNILSSQKKFFSTTNTTVKNEMEPYSYQITKLYEFKLAIDKLLEEKIYSFSCYSQSDCKELRTLQKVSKADIETLAHIIKKDRIKYIDNKTNFLKEKAFFINLYSIPMDYSTFKKFLYQVHEDKEEEINNLIRDMLERNLFSEKQKQDNATSLKEELIQIRDDWRNSFEPEILDKDSNQIEALSFLDRIEKDLSKRITNLLI